MEPEKYTKEQEEVRKRLMEKGVSDSLIMHSKTKRYYYILCTSRDSETQEFRIVYVSLYGDNIIWDRPASMFDDDVEINGVFVKRFVPAFNDKGALDALSEFLRKKKVLI